jgi:hypothetical protein
MSNTFCIKVSISVFLAYRVLGISRREWSSKTQNTTNTISKNVFGPGTFSASGLWPFIKNPKPVNNKVAPPPPPARVFGASLLGKFQSRVAFWALDSKKGMYVKGPAKPKKSVSPVGGWVGQRPKKDQGQVYFSTFVLWCFWPPLTEKRPKTWWKHFFLGDDFS